MLKTLWFTPEGIETCRNTNFANEYFVVSFPTTKKPQISSPSKMPTICYVMIQGVHEGILYVCTVWLYLCTINVYVCIKADILCMWMCGCVCVFRIHAAVCVCTLMIILEHLSTVYFFACSTVSNVVSAGLLWFEEEVSKEVLLLSVPGSLHLFRCVHASWTVWAANL